MIARVEKYISISFKLDGMWLWCQFSFRFSKPNRIPFFVQNRKGKLAPRSYSIKFKTRKWKYIFARAWREINPFVPTVAFSLLSSNICCLRDCVSRHNGGTSGAPLKPLRDDSALRTLSSLRGIRGAPAVPPLCRETQSFGQQMLNATVGINGLRGWHLSALMDAQLRTPHVHNSSMVLRGLREALN